MNEARIIELEIKQSYQEDLLQALNTVVASQQQQITKLEETCKRLNDKIHQLAMAEPNPAVQDERPPHY
jgi:SlyX protein